MRYQYSFCLTLLLLIAMADPLPGQTNLVLLEDGGDLYTYQQAIDKLYGSSLTTHVMNEWMEAKEVISPVMQDDAQLYVRKGKYYYNSLKGEKMYKGLISLSDGFEDLVSSNKEAHMAFQRSATGNLFTLGGSFLLMVSSLNMLVGTIKDAQMLNEGQFPNSDRSVRDAAFVITSAGVMLATIIYQKHHQNRGVKLFNAGL
jgi:hypothetical protein